MQIFKNTHGKVIIIINCIFFLCKIRQNVIRVALCKFSKNTHGKVIIIINFIFFFVKLDKM